MHVLGTVLARLEKLDHSLPVVLKDSDLLLGDSLLAFEEAGWHCLRLVDMDREFLTLLEAESLAQSGRKVLVYLGNRSEKELVFLAEYWDRGNRELVSAINLLSELGIDRKDARKDFLVSLVRYGLNKSESWWQELKSQGLDAIDRKAKEDIWELLRDSHSADGYSDAEKEFLFVHFANRAFGLNLSASSSPEEAATRIGEKILEASYKREKADAVYRDYKEWADSRTYRDCLREHSYRFAQSHGDELLDNLALFESDHNHPFPKVEKELFERRVAAFLNGDHPHDVVAFARDRAEKRKGRVEDRDDRIDWQGLADLEPLLHDLELGSIDSLQAFLAAYKESLYKVDALDRRLRTSLLPKRLVDWALENIAKRNQVLANHWKLHYHPGGLSGQAGLLYRILQGEGKKAVIVVDALRYELVAELDPGCRVRFKAEPLLAMTPTETPVGMGALFSSGQVTKRLKERTVLLVDQQTGRTLDSVSAREQNLKVLVPDVQVCDVSSQWPESQKIVFKTRDIDTLGHEDLLHFYSQTMQQLSSLAGKLLKAGYEVHFASDHGFYLPLPGESVKQDGTGSYSSGVRYSLNTAPPVDGKWEEVDGSYLLYAQEGNVFKNYGGHFWHGGITHQEAIVPHLTLTPDLEERRWGVTIGNKDRLKKLQKDRVDLQLFAEKELFGSGRRVYVQYLDQRVEIPHVVDDHAVLELRINAASGTRFRIEVRDLEDGSLLDKVECTYLPARQRLFD